MSDCEGPLCQWGIEEHHLSIQEHRLHAFCQTPARTLSQRGLAVQAGQALTFDAIDQNEVLLRVFCRFGRATAPWKKAGDSLSQ